MTDTPPASSPMTAVQADDLAAAEVAAGIMRRTLAHTEYAGGSLIDVAPGTQWPDVDVHATEEGYYVPSREVIEGEERYGPGTYASVRAGKPAPAEHRHRSADARDHHLAKEPSSGSAISERETYVTDEQQRNMSVLTRHLAAEQDHQMAETLATLHPECLFEDQPLGWTLRGREGARQHYEFWWSTFGVHLDAGQLHWTRDDLAIGEAVFAGRHVGDFFGRSATGRSIVLPFVVIVSFRDGLLAGERFTYDMASLLRQLGYDVLDPAAARAA